MQRKARTHLTYRYTLDTLLRKSYYSKGIRSRMIGERQAWQVYGY
jgi:hypothetical protein